jgi:hypothetical protein
MLSWRGVAIMMAGLIGVAAVNAGDSENQIITLKDGTRLTFLGLTYGTHHVAPHYERLPTGNPIYTPKDATVAWVEAEHDPGRWPSFELLVSDKAKTGCVNSEKRSSSHVKNGLDVLGFVLDAYPRWDKEMVIRAKPYNEAIAPGQFLVSNAEPVSLEEWTPEHMPVTKSDGDFEVTLTKVIAGVSKPYWRGKPPPEKDVANQCVRIAFHFRQNGASATNWLPRLIKTTDAAGNFVLRALSEYPQDGIFDHPQPGKAWTPRMDGYFYRPGLWPDASPWKLRMEFTRTSGFDDFEILTLTNLAVRAGSQEEADEAWSWDDSKTNFTYTTATVNGVRVKVLEPLLYPAAILNGEKHIRVMIYTDPTPPVQELRMTLIAATDDEGQPIWSPFPSSWAGHYDLDFPRPREIKSLNLKLALHKSRFVEFTVKPAKM